ncbi:hypothetical protein ACODT5_00920 [Streptomyces sp. 5.8]|uniref:hypothetical protein n=1 Tax=Streptomyces sp. 5.8 TaxID=3406571 RepID=UPI003BB6ECE7
MPFHSPTEIQLHIGDNPVPASSTFDRFTGRARYHLNGHGVRGNFIVIPETVPGSDSSHVRIEYGDHPVGGPQNARMNEPRIRRTRVRGECGPLSVDASTPNRQLNVRGQWVRSDGTVDVLPFATRHHLTEVVRAIVAHWATRPNRDGLIRAAARHAQQQPDIPARAYREAVERELADIRAQIAPHWSQLQRLEAIAQAPAPQLPTMPDTVRIDFHDPATGETRILSARPQLNPHDGTITYTVTHGATVRGAFTVGPDRFSPDALPGGVTVLLGTTRRLDGIGREDEPTVNGARVSGSWNCADLQQLTPALPEIIPGIQRADVSLNRPLTAASSARISAVIRALAIAYRDHVSVEALRLAAGKSRVDQLRQAPVEAVVALRQREAAAQARMNAALEADAAFASLSA